MHGTTDGLYFIFDLFYKKYIFLSIDLATQRYDLNVELPNLLIEAEYGVDGKVLLLPIKGSGPMTANVSKYQKNI